MDTIHLPFWVLILHRRMKVMFNCEWNDLAWDKHNDIERFRA